MVVAVLVVRSTSTFAAVTRRADEVADVAQRAGLRPEEGMALLDLHPDLDAAGFAAHVGEVVRARARVSDLALAVAVAYGHGALVDAALAAEAGDAARARTRVRATHEGLVVTRFVAMVERYRDWLAVRR